ncbi:MAG: DUF2268 domain-containing putative Zn-dependent protease [Bacillota bacterium]
MSERNLEQVALLVQHEYAHLYRMIEGLEDELYWALCDNDPHRFPVSELLVNEGLATLAPAYVQDTDMPISSLLFYTSEQMTCAQRREADIARRIGESLDEPVARMDADAFSGFGDKFTADGLPKRYGYYAGAMLIRSILEEVGWDEYPALLRTDADTIISESSWLSTFGRG